MLVRSDQPPPPGRVLLKVITANMFDVVTGIAIIATIFYLAAITHIMPLPESVLSGVGEFASGFMNVLVACAAWVISFLP